MLSKTSPIDAVIGSARLNLVLNDPATPCVDTNPARKAFDLLLDTVQGKRAVDWTCPEDIDVELYLALGDWVFEDSHYDGVYPRADGWYVVDLSACGYEDETGPEAGGSFTHEQLSRDCNSFVEHERSIRLVAYLAPEYSDGRALAVYEVESI